MEVAEDEIPQGTVITPLLFLIIINNLFHQVPEDLGKSVIADDTAIWKIQHVANKLQEIVWQIQMWTAKRGFWFQLEMIKIVSFTRNHKVELIAQHINKV